MNPFNLSSITAIWSFRRELQFVLLAFLITLLIPIFAVILLTNAGIDIVSDRLATLNLQTHTIDIHDPATGKVIKQLHITAVWPVSGVVTLEFGESDLPFQPFHSGIDIANPNRQIGDPITAFMPGTVIYAGEIFWGFGKHIIIDNGDNITSIYGHLSAIYVTKGQQVKPADVIGTEGNTGWATGPHLHFQIDVFGIPVNPRTFLQGDP